MPSTDGLTYHLTWLLYVPYLGKLQDPKNREFSLKLQISVVIFIAVSSVSKMGMTELIFVIPGMKVNGQYYRDVLLALQMLPAIKHVASDTFVFQRDNAPAHRARTPLNNYSKKRRTSLVLISGHQTVQT